jgi:hypothetical protein
MPTPPGKPYPGLLAAAAEGAPYLHLLSVASTSPVDLTVEGALPAGLTLGTESLFGEGFELSGVPERRGTYQFTVVATNLFGESRLPVTLRVVPPPWFDINSDGIPDLPVGAPGEDVGTTADAGLVTVLLGAADGSYGRTGAVAITQETVGQRSEAGDRFGATIAAGEVTGDDYVDLIIGTPGEDKSAGQVVVVHGVAKGSAGAKRTVLRQGLAGAAGAAEAGDGFGSAISVGNGVWVGAPGEDLGAATDAGVATQFLTGKAAARFQAHPRRETASVPRSPAAGP